MNDKLFLIAVGGTGMRCLESFVHLCAAGLFDNREIDILTLDTDQNNGNKGRVESLIHLYNQVKSNDKETLGGEAHADTFFSAKLNLHSFYTNYSKDERSTLKKLARQQSTLNREAKQENEDLLDLMFDADTVQEFDLKHGYRAQTHLGSLLMYHGIIEAARNIKNGKDVTEPERSLDDFLKVLIDNSTNARVFIFGSIFGGTGASSIPVLPNAIKEAIKIKTGSTSINFNTVKFASTLLTDYFTFNVPTEEEKKKEKVIADPVNFALNSKAALTFYNRDPSVRSNYKMLYHIGWPGRKTKYEDGEGGKVITGGFNQKNDAHVLELMCACAAYDFFNREDGDIPANNGAEYYYRTVDADDTGRLLLTGSSFVGEEGKKFEHKIAAFLAFAYFVLLSHQAAVNGKGTIQLIENLASQRKDDLPELSEFKNITPEKAKQIDEYMKRFAFDLSNGSFEKGWIYQINESLTGTTFLFTPEVFSTDKKEVMKIDYGKILKDPAHHWKKTGGFMANPQEKSYNTLIDFIKDKGLKVEEKQGKTLIERFYARIYNGISKAQNSKQ